MGPRLGEVAEAVEARAPRRVTLRPFAPFSGATEGDGGGGDWSFIDCEMEEVDLQDLPSATIACHLDPRVFVDGLCRVRTGLRSGRRADTCCGARPGRGRAAALLPGSLALEAGFLLHRLHSPDRVLPDHSRFEINSSFQCHGWLLIPSQGVKSVWIGSRKEQLPIY